MSAFDALNNIAIRNAKKQAQRDAGHQGSLAEQQLAATIQQNEILIYITKQLAELTRITIDGSQESHD